MNELCATHLESWWMLSMREVSSSSTSSPTPLNMLKLQLLLFSLSTKDSTLLSCSRSTTLKLLDRLGLGQKDTGDPAHDLVMLRNLVLPTRDGRSR